MFQNLFIMHSKHSWNNRRNLLAVTGALALTIGLTACGGHQPTATPRAESPLPIGGFSSAPSWEENFSVMHSRTLDPNVWRYELDPVVPTYNDEAQAYTSSPANVRIEPSVGLVIEARKEAYTYPGDTSGKHYEYTSGRIDTKNSFSFEYGKVVARMKLPGGAGSWAAMWMLSANEVHTAKLHPTDADWANERYYMKNGELDAMESYGKDSNEVPIEGTAHTFDKSNQGQLTVPDATTAFHDYGVELTPQKITWTVDGKPYYSVTKTSNNPNAWPFEGGNKFYPIINLAMGGSGGGTINKAAGTQRLTVSDIRYFALNK